MGVVVDDPMTIIKRGLAAFQGNSATETLGLAGLGTNLNEQRNDEVADRQKGITPAGSPLGSPAARSLLG